MRKDNGAMRLSEALRKAKARNWAPTPLREAVVDGRIASYRSSDKGRAWYYVQWRDVEAFFNGQRRPNQQTKKGKIENE